MRRARPSGQAATEYSLVLAVVVIGVVAASLVFVPAFKNGVMTTRSKGWINYDLPWNWCGNDRPAGSC